MVSCVLKDTSKSCFPMAKDYYSILGVPKSASQDEIKKAFRKLAHEHHPDKKGGNEGLFKEASEAYSVLSDDKKRAEYDSFGSGFGSQGGQGGGFNAQDFSGFDFSQFTNGQGGFEFDLGDIFGDMFGGGRGRTPRGRDLSMDVDISFEESVFGVDKEVKIYKTSKCKLCDGSGAKKGTQLNTCPVCAGKGKVHEVRRSIMGSFSTSRTCETCGGIGKVPKEKCENCHGKGLEKREEIIAIHIPSGIENNEMIRVTGYGEAIAGGITGDLYLKVHVRKHSLFVKDGANLRMDLKVKLTDTLLGANYSIKTLDGDVLLSIPEGTYHNEELRIRGKGVSTGGGKRGDIIATIFVQIPKKIPKDVKKLVEELREMGI